MNSRKDVENVDQNLTSDDHCQSVSLDVADVDELVSAFEVEHGHKFEEFCEVCIRNVAKHRRQQKQLKLNK